MERHASSAPSSLVCPPTAKLTHKLTHTHLGHPIHPHPFGNNRTAQLCFRRAALIRAMPHTPLVPAAARLGAVRPVAPLTRRRRRWRWRWRGLTACCSAAKRVTRPGQARHPHTHTRFHSHSHSHSHWHSQTHFHTSLSHHRTATVTAHATAHAHAQLGSTNRTGPHRTAPNRLRAAPAVAAQRAKEQQPHTHAPRNAEQKSEQPHSRQGDEVGVGCDGTQANGALLVRE